MRFTLAVPLVLLASVPAALLLPTTVFAQGEIIATDPWYGLPPEVPNTGFVSVVARGEQPPSVPYHWFNAAVRENGTLVFWGGSGPSGIGERYVSISPYTDIEAVSSPVESVLLHSDRMISSASLPPGPNERFVAVAAGPWHRLALRDDGSIAAWGLNTHGECNVPEPNVGYVAIAAAGSVFDRYGNSYAINEDGAIVGWGALGSVVITDPIRFVSVVASTRQMAAIRADGSAVVWSPPQCSPDPCTISGPFVDCAVRQLGDAWFVGIGDPLLLREDGTVVGGFPGEDNITAVACPDGYYSLAIRAAPWPRYNSRRRRTLPSSQFQTRSSYGP